MRSPQKHFPQVHFCCVAFTLIELLVSVAVVAVLSVLLFSGAKSIVESSRNAQCINNLRQMSVAAALYSQDNGGRWPPNTVSKEDRYYFSAEIQPYIVVAPGKLTKADKQSFRRGIFVCPSDRYEGESVKYIDGVYEGPGHGLSYAQNSYLNNETESYRAGLSRNQVRLPGQLMLFMDFEGHWVVSTSTMGVEGRRSALEQRHRGRANCAFADGHVGSVLLDDIWGRGGDAANPFPFFQGRSDKL